MAKTTFILAGGADRKIDGYNKRLGEVILSHVPRPRILSCLFASEQETWQEKAADWSAWFADEVIAYESYDYARLETFQDQIKRADVIYLHGGDDWLLLERLAKFPDLRGWLDGKVVVGSSAGSSVLVKNFWTASDAQPGKGLGLLDMHVMVHYGAKSINGRERDLADWEREKSEFQMLISDHEITPLSEGQFVVVTS